ncbi:helix-turn-helix domain-containing protein [Thermomonospora cellulosilytica]|uniref:Transcriptional regulator with XRE-family HTH domain n=1 Tax=Thermomonospora cellulosilytica TaxID=1411118 RepID=A0A7W3MZL1_9ACTN|nr:helix-turn-helix transcriptional regulator [Thermomonospora cellulosilytica]MBA9004812.1 transcriptional regulator with XRE-family HTH domain [Thermomonospora cellulosilytica]
MASPFVRRRRLGMELRAIREERGLTADQLARRIHYSRMQVSRLENGQVRPDIAELIKILKVLDVTGERRAALIEIACDGAERGWWDRLGNAMGARQRLYANIESGAATIREYNQTAMPGIFQTPEFIEALIELTRAEGALDFQPQKMMEGRLERQRAILRPGGPMYEVVLDEIVIRRLTVPPKVMAAQLRHMVTMLDEHPSLSVRVLPVDARLNGTLLPRATFTLYTFPDPADPPLAVVDTISTDHVHIEPREVQRYARRYEHLSQAALTPEDSKVALIEAADRATDQTGCS